MTLGAFPCNVFFSFLGQLRANRLLLRPFLDEWLPEMVSKPMDSRETSLKKSKKRQAIASVRSEALGGSWELGSSWGSLGEPGESSSTNVLKNYQTA